MPLTSPQGVANARSEVCAVAECKQKAIVHFCLALRKRVKEARCCEKHVQAFLDEYYGTERTGEGTPQVRADAVGFDIELVIYDGRPDKWCQFSLREVGGSRRFDCQVGPFEASSLGWELEQLAVPRPLTHRAMASLITALGGLLECVVIDKFFPAERMYEAKLHIQLTNKTLVVDVRPSDAVTLALVCNVPIFVSNDVLAGVAETQR